MYFFILSYNDNKKAANKLEYFYDLPCAKPMKYSLNNTTMQRDAKSTSFFHSKALATYSVLKTLLKTLPLFTWHLLYCLCLLNFEVQFTVQF